MCKFNISFNDVVVETDAARTERCDVDWKE